MFWWCILLLQFLLTSVYSFVTSFLSNLCSRRGQLTHRNVYPSPQSGHPTLWIVSRPSKPLSARVYNIRSGGANIRDRKWMVWVTNLIQSCLETPSSAVSSTVCSHVLGRSRMYNRKFLEWFPHGGNWIIVEEAVFFYRDVQRLWNKYVYFILRLLLKEWEVAQNPLVEWGSVRLWYTIGESIRSFR